VENDSPDKDMHLATPTAHLKTEFYVASPGYPHGILEYVTKAHNGEKAVTESFHHIIAATKCNGLVLDIGANTGFYSMLTLSEGCKQVVSFDPQPSCVRHIEHALVKNDFKHGAIVPRPVDYVSGRTLELNPKYDCAGRWPVQQHEDKAPDPADLIKVSYLVLLENSNRLYSLGLST
jgi:SAM-dependent methyltransferase